MHRRPPTIRRSWWSPATSCATRLRRLLGASAQLAVATIAAALLVVSCGGGDPAALQAIPGTNLQQLIADRNDPAVVLLVTEYQATITVPTLGYNDAALQALANQVVAEAETGQIGSDEQTMDNAFVAAIVANPGAYFTANQPLVQKDVTLDFQCTGSIVTPDGYIVTAAHCTDVPSDERLQGYVEQGLKPILDAAVQTFLADNPGFTSDQQQQLATAVTAYLSGQAQLTNESEGLYAAMFQSSGGNTQAVAKPLSLVTQGNAPSSSTGPFGDKDVSIVKLDGYNDLPTLPVGTDSQVDTGDQLYVDGYPAAAQVSSNLQSVGTPTMSAGSVSAEKTSDQGVPLLETTATSSGGDSGGPGFDQNGDMVGIVSFGTTSGADYNYLIGGSVVQEFLHEKNIQPRQSTTTTVYDTALNDYYRHYYKRALPEFQQVQNLDPSHPYVAAFIQKTQTAISQGKDQTPLLTTTQLAILIVVVAVLLLVVAGVVLLVLRRRRSHRAPPQPAATPAPQWAPAIAANPSYPPAGPAAPVAGAPPQPVTQPQLSVMPQPAPQSPAPMPPDQPYPAPTPSVFQGTWPPADVHSGDPAPSAPPPFAAPAGWVWDGDRFVPTGPSAGGAPAR